MSHYKSAFITALLLTFTACSDDGQTTTALPSTGATQTTTTTSTAGTSGTTDEMTGDPTTGGDTTSTTSTTTSDTTSTDTTTTDSVDTSTTIDVPTTGAWQATDSTTGEPEPPPGMCGTPGSLFGPCIEGVGCLGNFGCFSRQEGQVCIPTFTWAATHSEEIQDCVRKIGGNLVCGSEAIIEGWCVVACDSTCAPGLNCDDGDAQIMGDNVCVHPW